LWLLKRHNVTQLLGHVASEKNVHNHNTASRQLTRNHCFLQDSNK